VVSPIVLRETALVRLVFKPLLVDNPQDDNARVKGTFCYQRKSRTRAWEDVETIPLSSLRAGQGVKLDLHSGEILRLYRGLQILYDSAAQDGVQTGVHSYIRADRGTLLREIADSLEQGDANEEVTGVFLNWMQSSREALSRLDGRTLMSFDAVIGAARLTQFIEHATANLSNGDESYWQALLLTEPWAISQIYATPMVIVRDQAYVGGKSIDNRGGSIVDYMYRNALSDNSLIVELKTPVTRLLTRQEYRNGVYGPSADLGGGTQQLLHARQTLQEDYLTLTRGQAAGFRVFGTRALLVIGTLPSAADEAGLRSFEIYRNSHRGLDIVTFDELIKKAQLLLDVLGS